MKRIYLSPTSLTVKLSTCHMMAASLPVGEDGNTIDDENDILTKENKDVNLWSNEW